MSALHLFAAALLAGTSHLLWAIEPNQVEIGLYAQEQAFDSAGAVLGLNPSTLESDETGLILCNPGLNCDRLSIGLDLPEDTLRYFPFAQLRITLSWSSPTMLPIDDFDMYLYDLEGNLLGRADRTTLTDGIGEELVFPLAQIPDELVLEIYYFLSVAASYSGSVVLDLGPSAEGSDSESFWANNPPPPTARAEMNSGAGSASFGAWLVLLISLATRRARRGSP